MTGFALSIQTADILQVEVMTKPLGYMTRILFLMSVHLGRKTVSEKLCSRALQMITCIHQVTRAALTSGIFELVSEKNMRVIAV